MAKKRILVKGNVQGVGYRALVKKVARSLAVKGIARNLDDGTVEIFCEGDPGVLARFISTIDIKSGNGNLLAIDVKELEEHPEGTAGYTAGRVPQKFKSFDIEYGQDLSVADREMIERQELLIVGGSQVLAGLGVVGMNVKELGSRIDTVGHSVIGMHGDMNEKFMKMEKKYHTINENIERSNRNIERLIVGNTKTNKSLESMSKALVKLIEKDIAQRKKAQKVSKKR